MKLHFESNLDYHHTAIEVIPERTWSEEYTDSNDLTGEI